MKEFDIVEGENRQAIRMDIVLEDIPEEKHNAIENEINIFSQKIKNLVLTCD